MRKKLLLLLIIGFVIFLTGCNTNSSHYYKVKVEGNVDELMNPLNSEYKSGTKVEIKLYPVTDASRWVFVNGERIKNTHFDSDYWGYEFIMPSEDVIIYITHDRFYGQNEYTFDELFYWKELLNIDNVTKVRVETGAIGVAPGSLVDIEYSEDETDIAILLDLLNQKLVKTNDPKIDGGSYVKYTYYVENCEYELRITNQFVLYTSLSTYQYFSFEDKDYRLPKLSQPYLQCHSFLASEIDSEVYDNNHFLVGKYAYLPYLEFIEEDSEFMNVQASYYIEAGFGNVYVKTPKIFVYNDKQYKIMNEYEFNFVESFIKIDYPNPQKNNVNVEKIAQIINNENMEFFNITPSWIIDEYHLNVFETKDKSDAYLMYENEVISLYPFDSAGSGGVKHFCIADMNSDGYVELYLSVDYGRNRIFNVIYCFDTCSKKIIESYTDYKKVNYFKFMDNTLMAGDFLLIKKRDIRFNFDKLNYYVNCDTFKAEVKINPNDTNFPIAFEYIGENASYVQEYSIILDVETQYIGPTYTYMGSSTIYGAIVSFINNENTYSPEMYYTADYTKITIFKNTEFSNKYSIEFPNDIQKGPYDLLISYNGVVITIENALTIS